MRVQRIAKVVRVIRRFATIIERELPTLLVKRKEKATFHQQVVHSSEFIRCLEGHKNMTVGVAP